MDLLDQGSTWATTELTVPEMRIMSEKKHQLTRVDSS